MGVKDFIFYSKEDAAIALVFIMYDGNWTNNLLVVILFIRIKSQLFLIFV